jgi:Tol biopolymer transport system component
MHSLKGSEHKRFEERTAMNTRTDPGTERATWKRATTWLVVFAGALALATTVLAQKGGKPGGGGGTPAQPAIAFIGDAGDSLKVMDADGANQTVVFKKSRARMETWTAPQWHPNGEEIFFTHKPNQGGGWGLYRINVSGSGLTTIIAPPADQLSAIRMGDVAPFPNARGKHRLAFIPSLPQPQGIFVADEDQAGHPGNWTQLAPERSECPSWSPDGRYLAYRLASSLRLLTLAEDNQGNIRVEDDAVLLDPNSSGLFVSWVSFSKSASKIYFSASQGAAARDLWALYLDNDMTPILIEQLTDTPEFDEVFVSSSADDSRIACSDNGDYNVILLANSDGTEPRVVTMPSERQSRPSFKR